MVDELRKAPSDVLSFEDAVNDVHIQFPPNVLICYLTVHLQLIQKPFTLGPEVAKDTHRLHVVLSQLTRNLDVLFPELRDEIVLAFGDLIPVCGNGNTGFPSPIYALCEHILICMLHRTEWTKLPALETVMKIVARVSNRLFVGLPLCMFPTIIAFRPLPMSSVW